MSQNKWGIWGIFATLAFGGAAAIPTVSPLPGIIFICASVIWLLVSYLVWMRPEATSTYPPIATTPVPTTPVAAPVSPEYTVNTAARVRHYEDLNSLFDLWRQQIERPLNGELHPLAQWKTFTECFLYDGDGSGEITTLRLQVEDSDLFPSLMQHLAGDSLLLDYAAWKEASRQRLEVALRWATKLGLRNYDKWAALTPRVAAKDKQALELIKPWQEEDVPLVATLEARTKALKDRFFEISQRGLPGDCRYCRQFEVIVDELELQYGRAVLKVVNRGTTGATFQARGMVVEGNSKGESYPIPWDCTNDAACKVDAWGMAKLMVGLIARESNMGEVENYEDVKKAVFKDRLALYRWGPSGRETFGVFIPVAKPDRDHPKFHTEDGCILEITITSTAPLPRPFKRHYRLRIRGKLEFYELPEENVRDKGE